jgi:5-methylcytosine-specific restriction protein A
MPTVPTQVKCSHLGCKEHRSRLNTYCINHGGLDNLAYRESDSLYSSKTWKTIRQRQLSRQPLCQSCLLIGRVEAANNIDHVFPWKAIGQHAFTRNIMQSLCHECHSHKTAQERQGICLHYTSEAEVQYRVNEYNMVIDRLYTE